MSKGSNKSIIINTIYLLIKLLLSMIANLYISRVVLNILGITDFGIYNIVTGVVIMLTMVTGSLSSAVSRFLNYEMGKKIESRNINTIYSTSIIFHFSLALIICIIAYTLGDYVIYNLLNIPIDRLASAVVIYYLAVFSFAITLISVTFNALVIANEDMKGYSVIGISDICFKLFSLILLSEINYDKLELYSFLFTISVFLNFSIFFAYTKVKYKNIKFSLDLNKKTFIEICGFAGWNSIGTGSILLKDQGVNILVNIFFGAQLNAARAISYQVSNALSSIVNHLMLAVNPRITKLIAANNAKESISLAIDATRYSFYFMLIISVPLLIETDRILNVWLVEVPDFSVLFVKLITINLLIDTLSKPLITLMLANGNIRNFQIVVGFANALNFPISYIFLNMGLEVQVTMYVSIFISLLSFILRLYMLSINIEISIIDYVKRVIVTVFPVSLISIFLSLIIVSVIEENLIISDGYYIIYNILAIILSCIIVVLFLGCKKTERKYVFSKLKFSGEK